MLHTQFIDIRPSHYKRLRVKSLYDLSKTPSIDARTVHVYIHNFIYMYIIHKVLISKLRRLLLL